jgi:putative OPT family oligopeptide transporter
MSNSSEGARAKELTIRGIVLGIGLTLLFTAANIYLGLKVGLTFATSIPAAVISMAVLSVFSGSNIRENNIVQTLTSSAGAMASIIFVLPGLVIVGWWQGFPFWTSFLLCAAGGILGVLFTIPLRRALVTASDLPYPEGVAAAQVLRVGSDRRIHAPAAREGLLAIIYGALASAGFAALAATRLAVDGAKGFFALGMGASGYAFSYSLALLGAGHLVGISVGAAMALGIVIAWGGVMPILTALAPHHALPLADLVMKTWNTQLRFIGAGAMGVAAFWSLARTIGPVLSGVVQVVRVRHGARDPLDHSDRDISLGAIAGLTALCTALCGLLVWRFANGTTLQDHALVIALICVPIILFGGFLIAAICGYMAGLIGSSNSPVSGVGILAVTGCAVALLAVLPSDAHNGAALVAVTLFLTAILFAGAVSSNDNLQDLKTGQLVGAAPWRQQIALMIGVVAASAIIPFILDLLARAYGFAGAPNLGTVTAQPLPAPQANLIATLAQGVIGHRIDWHLIGIGAAIGAGIVVLDEILAARKLLRIPPLAAGIGIYLPMAATLPVVAGALLGWFYNKVARTDHARGLGVLVASGMIVGESLFGVASAGLIVGFNHDAPLALVGPNFVPAPLIGLIGFAAAALLLYGWLLQRRRKEPV